MLLVQRGRELGYTLSDEQFKSVARQHQEGQQDRGRAKFQAALKQEGMTLADLRRQLEQNMLEPRVQQNEVLAKISVTEDEAHAYYDAHKNEFTTPSAAHAARDPGRGADERRGVNVAEDDAAKAKAEDIGSGCWAASRSRGWPPKSPTRRRRPTAA